MRLSRRVLMVRVMSLSSSRPTYGNFSRPRTAGLSNLSSLATAIIFLGFLATISAFMLGDVWAALVVALIFALLTVLVVAGNGHGMSLLEIILEAAMWQVAKLKKENRYRSGPAGQVPGVRFTLPGIGARLSVADARDGFGRDFAVVELGGGLYSITFASEPDGASLVDPEVIDKRVAQWGAFLASLTVEPGLVGAQVTVESSPDTGDRLALEVGSQVDPEAPGLAREVLSQLVETYPMGSAKMRTWITLTFRGRSKNAEEVRHELATQLPGLSARLMGTGAGAVRPVASDELAEIIRMAYDPMIAPDIERARVQGDPVKIDFEDAGPSALDAHWRSMDHDSGTSMSWTLAVPPRGKVYSSILSRLLEPDARLLRKRVSLVFSPIESGRAANIVETDRRNAQIRVRSVDRPSARSQMELASAERTADEEAAGAGLTDFSMIATATGEHGADLRELESTIANAAATARVKLRPAYGAQSSAFLMALPLGFIPAQLSRVPAAIKAAL